jgi:NTP pyrophosphatase (non-canonical NTP hydrolase)
MNTQNPVKVVMYTEKEGGRWNDLPKYLQYEVDTLFHGDGPLHYVGNDPQYAIILPPRDLEKVAEALAVHALLFSDGREWDVLNGFRPPLPDEHAKVGQEYFASQPDLFGETPAKKDIDYYVECFKDWGAMRGLHSPTSENAKAQLVKLVEEVGELAGDIARGRDVKDSIGDCLVVLTQLAAVYSTSLQECAGVAWNSISSRQGTTVGGVFIKEEDS